MTYQIRSEGFGHALYDAATAREALYAFLADRVRGEVRQDVEEAEDGSSATVVYRGERLTAVRTGGVENEREAYRAQVRETLHGLSDEALRFQDSIIRGGIDREECDRELRSREN